MLQQKEGVGDPAGLAVIDQGALQRQAVRIRNEPEPATNRANYC